MTKTNKDLVFIASGGRTGTTFFAEVLGRIVEDCHSAHEPDILHSRYPFQLRQIHDFGLWEIYLGRLLGMAGPRVLGTRLMMGEIDLDTVVGRLRRSRRRWHSHIRERLVIESNGPIWMVGAYLEQIWPGSKLIGIVRDPRTWVRSFMNHRGRYDKDDRADWLPPGRLTPAKLGQAELAERWGGWGTFEKLAWEWNVINSELTRAADLHPTARIWRFEDLFGGGTADAEALVRFACDHGARQYRHDPITDALGRKVNASVGSAQDWEQWTPAQGRLVEELCGGLMRRYGYGAEPEWRALLAS